MKEVLITSSVLIVALLLLRLVFAKKVSRRLIYAAWLLVALRLLVPVQIGELDFSVLTAAQPLTETMTEFEELRVLGQTENDAHKQVIKDYIENDRTVFTPEVQQQIADRLENGNMSSEETADYLHKVWDDEEIFTPESREEVAQQVADATDPISLGQVATVLWLCGVACMAVWFLLVNLRHSRKLRRGASRLVCESPIPVYVSEHVDSPCLVGLFRPRIYLTSASAAEPQKLRHVLTHELTHYAHKDHIWSVVRCLCLCIYWFNPLVWAAAFFSRRDCELACDEGALKRLGEAERIAYGKTLLEEVSHAATPGKLLQTATAMSETKKQLKQRIDFIVSKRKISVVAVTAMVLICAIVAGCVAAGPTTDDGDHIEVHTPSVTTAPQITVPSTTEPDPDFSIPEMTAPSVPPEPLPTDPEPTEPEPTDPEPTEPEPTEPEPTDPEPTQPEPTEPKPTEPEPTEPIPTLSAEDEILYERAIAALDAYTAGGQAYFYDESGEYYGQDALWQICSQLLRLDEYIDCGDYLQNFAIKDLKVGEVWRISTGNTENAYKTVENNKFTYNDRGLLTGMYSVAQYGNFHFTMYSDLKFFYTDDRLDYYEVYDDDYLLASVTCIYDGNGYLTEEKVTGSYEYSIYYAYDAAGRLSGWTSTRTEGAESKTEVEYIYDAQGRLIQTKRSYYLADYMFPDQVELVESEVADYTYDENGLLQSISSDVFSWNDGEVYNLINHTTTFTYDSYGRVQSQYRKTGPMTDLEGNVLDDITRHWEEVTCSYETVIYYIP